LEKERKKMEGGKERKNFEKKNSGILI